MKSVKEKKMDKCGKERIVYVVQSYHSMDIQRVFTSSFKALKYVECFCKRIDKTKWGFIGYMFDDSEDEPMYYIQKLIVR